eukprot:scaffold128_cov248-Pinguiococcus_pyrenoidosus.AAC.4
MSCLPNTAREHAQASLKDPQSSPAGLLYTNDDQELHQLDWYEAYSLPYALQKAKFVADCQRPPVQIPPHSSGGLSSAPAQTA